MIVSCQMQRKSLKLSLSTISLNSSFVVSVPSSVLPSSFFCYSLKHSNTSNDGVWTTFIDCAVYPVSGTWSYYNYNYIILYIYIIKMSAIFVFLKRKGCEQLLFLLPSTGISCREQCSFFNIIFAFLQIYYFFFIYSIRFFFWVFNW